MGYDIARSFVLDYENMRFSGSFACSNVTPRTFERFESLPETGSYSDYDAYKDGLMTKQEIFAASVLSDILGGSIQLSKSVSVKYRYAIHKLKEFIEYDNSGRSEYSLWSANKFVSNKKSTCYLGTIIVKSDADWRAEMIRIKSYVSYFLEVLSTKNPSGEYIIEMGTNYIAKVNHVTYQISYFKSGAKVYKNKWSAELDAASIGGTVVEKNLIPALT